ncbi:hypothetical protein JQ600_06310 [Bradyrhizobium sp. AUGA SZCCT0176]|uniref:hypothetical protein n=1 Tax=Bradyrhizobium sp. AUGA SZCCT0176 TaxID=2807664 RepID=UPI001BAD8453|nr:hypothetical protein [Bradyrhizobium sp. AUGA SZCCT0176]MBR1224523.1 hypothetical protein [Bradyrhizobium sp. AUGA SZCCT0176]
MISVAKLRMSTAVILIATHSSAYAQPYCPEPLKQHSIVFNDKAALADRFSFRKTINAVLKSQGIAVTKEAAEKLVSTMLSSFVADDFVNRNSQLRMQVSERPMESVLKASDLLDADKPDNPFAMVPVGLFNRLDLVPEDWSDCGEHRIVYTFNKAIDHGNSPPASRMTIIFEARLRNPLGGQIGCQPVAEFWANLSKLADGGVIADELDRFYYTGLSANIGPVVHADNYRFGQVRGNLFVNKVGTSTGPVQWNLREWIITSVDGNSSSFVPVTVKTNPLAELYGAGVPATAAPQARAATVKDEFWREFKGSYLGQLIEFDEVATDKNHKNYDKRLDRTAPEFDLKVFKSYLFSKLGARFDDKFNEFQSSVSPIDNPMGPAIDNTAFKQTVVDPEAARLAKVGVDSTQLVARAAAVTCAGCHNFFKAGPPAGTAPIAKLGAEEILWPASLNFVHIDEKAALSPALTEFFIPFRREQLEKLVCKPSAPITVEQLVATAEVQARDRSILRLQQSIRALAPQTAPLGAGTTGGLISQIQDDREAQRLKPGFFVQNRRSH